MYITDRRVHLARGGGRGGRGNDKQINVGINIFVDKITFIIHVYISPSNT